MVRNPARAGSAGFLELVIVIGIIFILLCLALDGYRKFNHPAEPKPEPAPNATWRELDYAQGTHASGVILTDPVSGHRWLIVSYTSGTAVVPLQPGEFEPLPEGK